MGDLEIGIEMTRDCRLNTSGMINPYMGKGVHPLGVQKGLPPPADGKKLETPFGDLPKLKEIVRKIYKN